MDQKVGGHAYHNSGHVVLAGAADTPNPDGDDFRDVQGEEASEVRLKDPPRLFSWKRHLYILIDCVGRRILYCSS